MADLSTWLPWSVILAVVFYVWRRLEARMDQLEARMDQLQARLKACGRILGRSECRLVGPSRGLA
ncbi:MAG: hypothetical protein OXG13_19995 [Gemmatimonadaceae bacterium]|nr:hypothetical protein [Gemmatimonadaceae bacterium]